PRLHYLEWNPTAACTLILLHGNSANAWWWRPMAEVLAAADLRILAIDLRGHGDSEWVRPPDYSPSAYAGDLARFIVDAGGTGAIAAGHSMGGIAVLAFASRYPRLVRGVAAIDIAITSGERRNRYLRRLRTIPTVCYPDLATAMARFRLMPNEGSIAPEVISEIAKSSIQRTAAGTYTMKFDRESFSGSDGIDVAATIAAVRVPTLLVRAERSRIMSAEAALNAKRSNALIELVSIPHAHHHLPLESPHALANVLEQFAAAHIWSFTGAD
ncbi:MAG TPA: alpha/beta hydrolase, partial [Candidatus Binataceae bacterium]|nr:alpha/beta hydrolase [Candidatus Binataceae bacterium]